MRLQAIQHDSYLLFSVNMPEYLAVFIFLRSARCKPTYFSSILSVFPQLIRCASCSSFTGRSSFLDSMLTAMSASRPAGEADFLLSVIRLVKSSLTWLHIKNVIKLSSRSASGSVTLARLAIFWSTAHRTPAPFAIIRILLGHSLNLSTFSSLRVYDVRYWASFSMSNGCHDCGFATLS